MSNNMDLVNFYKITEKRYILVLDEETRNDKSLMVIQNLINKKLALLAQDLNILIPDRQIPYAKVEFVERIDNDKLRIICVDRNDDGTDIVSIEDNGYSHLLSLKINSGHCDVLVDENEDFEAKLQIDNQYLVCSIIDVMLDIMMFNSYSFLRELPLADKQHFSGMKYEDYKNKAYRSFYFYKKNFAVSHRYFSFAFAAREEKDDIDLNRFIYFWDEFIKSHYPMSKNDVGTIIEQLKKHRSFNQITSEGAKKDISELFAELGSKLLLRTNSRPNTKRQEEEICNYFGIDKYHIGALKVVDATQYYNPKLERFLQPEWVSAFKVVVTKDNIKK